MDNEYVKSDVSGQHYDATGVLAVIALTFTLFALVVHADWRDSSRCSKSGALALQNYPAGVSPPTARPPAKGANAPAPAAN